MFNKEDWKKRQEGLNEARTLLAERDTKPNALDGAIWNAWRMAEYAVNAGLELLANRTDRGHQLDKSVDELLKKKLLSRSYSKILIQLERYRKKVEYGSYSREPSVHFNAKNVQDCLNEVQALSDEIAAHLERMGRLP